MTISFVTSGYSPLRLNLRRETIITEIDLEAGYGLHGEPLGPPSGWIEGDGEVLPWQFQRFDPTGNLIDQGQSPPIWEVTIHVHTHEHVRAHVRGTQVTTHPWRERTMRMIQRAAEAQGGCGWKPRTPLEWWQSRTPRPWASVKLGELRPEGKLAATQQHEFVALAVAGLVALGDLLEHPDQLTRGRRGEIEAWSDERQSLSESGGLAVAHWLAGKALDGDAVEDLRLWCMGLGGC